MNRISKRVTMRNDADEPCCVYLDHQANPLVEIPLYELAELIEVYGVREAHKHIIAALEAELGVLTSEEREVALLT